MEITLQPADYSIVINRKELIKNLFDVNLGSAFTELISINDTKERKAFLLMFTAVQKTNVSFAKHYCQEALNSTYDLVSITNELELEIKSFLTQEVKIRHEFFKDVLKDNNNYIITAFNLFEKFYKKLGATFPEDIRLKYYHDFRFYLEKEFQENKEKYKELIVFFENPIFEQNIRFGKILEYYISIKNFFTDSLQKEGDNKETLQSLYIEPFFEIHIKNLISEYIEDIDDKFFKQSTNITIHEFFNNYFFKDIKLKELKENYDMIFLLGQPGQGKTSFCYKLIYDYLENNQDLPEEPLFFVKIRDLIAQDFISNPFDTINKYISNIVNLENEKGFLILDGLDEAYMSGGINENDLRNLYERLKKRSNKKLKIVLTSRFNYLQVDDACLDNTLIIHLSNLTNEQILQYSEKFKKFYPDNHFANQIQIVLSDDKYIHVKELLQQAVLIYFIGISNITIDESDSRAIIYDKVFDAMAQRSWDKNSGQLDYINPKMKTDPVTYKKHLRNYLSSLAFEIYQSPKLFITLKHLNSLEATRLFIKKCFQENLDSPDKIREINKYLLISFYFQESKNSDNGETAIEFFHNSLFEYLAAEYFWEQNKKILLKKDEDNDLIEVNYKDYFNFLNKLVGNKVIYSNITQNLIGIISNEETNIAKLVYYQSIKLFYKLLKEDFLLDFNREESVLTAKEKIRELFKLCWYFIYNSNLAVNDRLNIDDDILDYLLDSISFDNQPIINLYLSLEFTDRSLMFYHCDIDNCYFSIHFIRFDMSSSNLLNTAFEDITFDDHSFINNCRFKNVVFKDCEFDNVPTKIKDNFFIDCIFNNIEVPNKEWLFNNFIKNNYIDPDIFKNHFIDKREVTSYTGDISIKYYIMAKNFN
ncbi:NACHT domain-containing protein [uncultured Chryseobacterium sp.]|uniref:NACHT domain-containing protein n=1 Tax=uncultured Chryseobacterium sp. TaxID=259322 RepID=UPI0025854F6F|nr:NACHT domain-containing protein [uncultured Chryseobacterium sp.]